MHGRFRVYCRGVFGSFLRPGLVIDSAATDTVILVSRQYDLQGGFAATRGVCPSVGNAQPSVKMSYSKGAFSGFAAFAYRFGRTWYSISSYDVLPAFYEDYLPQAQAGDQEEVVEGDYETHVYQHPSVLFTLGMARRINHYLDISAHVTWERVKISYTGNTWCGDYFNPSAIWTESIETKRAHANYVYVGLGASVPVASKIKGYVDIQFPLKRGKMMHYDFTCPLKRWHEVGIRTSVGVEYQLWKS